MKIRSITDHTIILPYPCLYSLLYVNFWELNSVPLIFEPHYVRFYRWVVTLVTHVSARLFGPHRHVGVERSVFTSMGWPHISFHSRVKRCSVPLVVKRVGFKMGEFGDCWGDQLSVVRDRGVHHGRVTGLPRLWCWHYWAISVEARLVRVARSLNFIVRFKMRRSIHRLAVIIGMSCWSFHTFLVQNWGYLTNRLTVHLVKILRCGHLALYLWLKLITLLLLRLIRLINLAWAGLYMVWVGLLQS